MAKEKEEVKTEEKVNQPANAPIAPEGPAMPVSRETLSHQWQADSPAINTNALAGYGSQQNIVSDMAAAAEDAKKDKKEKKEKPLSDAEFERRTRLDVSNPEYMNPSLDYGK